MSLVELGGIAAVGFGIGLSPGIHHLLTFRKEQRQWQSPEAVEFLAERIAKAKRSVDIVSSDMNPFVFNPLVPLISHQLEMKPKLRVRLITSPRIIGLRSTPSEPSENQLYNLAMTKSFGDQLQMKVAKTTPEYDFGLIDTLHLYIEESHEPESLSCVVTTYKNSGLTAIRYQSKFDEMWQAIEEIPLEQAAVLTHKLETTDPEEVRQILQEIEALPILQNLQAG